MPIDTLARGTDVLRARAAEMAGHAHGRLARSPGTLFETAKALVDRTLAASARLATLEPFPADPAALELLREAADRLASDRGREVHLGYDWPWKMMDALAPTVLRIEARLRALDHLPEIPGGVLERLEAEVFLDGGIHRHEERFFGVIELLVTRVLGIEGRVDRLEASAKKAG